MVLWDSCGTEDLVILKNSIFPESALIGIRMPKRPDADHNPCALGGNMRNLKQHVSEKRTDRHTDA